MRSLEWPNSETMSRVVGAKGWGRTMGLTVNGECLF